MDNGGLAPLFWELKKVFKPETCYMCDQLRTSKEHVPPKCLFPEVSYLKEMGLIDLDLRKNLIKVPSCDAHNTEKSKDDEYLLYALGTGHSINKLGETYFLLKVKRAMKRNPNLMNRLLTGSEPVIFKDEVGEFGTLKIQAEFERLVSIMDKIGRGIYYKIFKNKWLDGVYVDMEFLVAERTIEEENFWKNFRNAVQNAFISEMPMGENKEVFNYNYKEVKENDMLLMRLGFYEKAKVNLIFAKSRIM